MATIILLKILLFWPKITFFQFSFAMNYTVSKASQNFMVRISFIT